MLAIATTDALSIVDPATLKRSPPSLPSCLALTSPPSAISWSPDNSFLVIAAGQTIQKYDPSSNSLLQDVYTDLNGVEDIPCVVVTDRDCILFSSREKIHLLEGKTVTQTFGMHKSPISSMALSSDLSLLASTCVDSVHIRNMAQGSTTSLRGLPLGQDITTCTFHPHSRTRLLVGVGKQLVVYDTAKPSAPVKAIGLGDGVIGNVVAIACSPFSKTLVACCTSGGNVGLVDLEKEKGLFRALNLKAALTSISFSPEGATIYLGTENGKLLVLDLRGLDKPPKSIVISENGARIGTMSVQKKTISLPEPSSKTPPISATSSTNTSPKRPSASGSGSISRSKVAKITESTVASPARRMPSIIKPNSASSTPTLRKSAVAGIATEAKKVFSPSRNAQGNVDSGSLRAKRENLKSGAAGTPGKGRPSTNSRSPLGLGSVASTMQSISTATVRARPAPVQSSPSTRPSRAAVSTKNSTNSLTTGLGIRARTLSSASRTTTGASESVSTRLTSRTGTTTTKSASSSRVGSVSASSKGTVKSATVIPPVPPVPAQLLKSKSANTSPVETETRSPSPDLPDIHDDPTTPVRTTFQETGMARSQSPQVEEEEDDIWVQAAKMKKSPKKQKKDKGKGKGKGKSVGFQDEDEEETGGEEDKENIEEGDSERSLIISPRRPSHSRHTSASWAPSPLRNAIPTTSPSGKATSAQVQEFLRTIIHDVMYDFQRETRAELTGLHLDLLKAGRGWKKEVRDLREAVLGDTDGNAPEGSRGIGEVGRLRKENERLRDEIERLRRGY